jgi:hypothetical protein
MHHLKGPSLHPLKFDRRPKTLQGAHDVGDYRNQKQDVRGAAKSFISGAPERGKGIVHTDLALEYPLLKRVTRVQMVPGVGRASKALVRHPHLSPGLIGVSRLRYNERRSVG